VIRRLGLSKLGVPSRFVPEMENLDPSSFGKNSIVHVYRRMLKVPYARVSAHGCAQIREFFQQIDVIEKPVGKTLGRPWMIPPGPKHDLFQIS